MPPIERRRTPKTAQGRRRRVEILAAAAELIHTRGVHGTSVEDVLNAAGAGKSQLYHYFGGKKGLVRAVLQHQAEKIFTAQEPHLARLDSLEGIEAWFAAILDHHRSQGFVGGCPIGSLAAEMADQDEVLRSELVAAFRVWEKRLEEGLSAMKARGELDAGADPESLARFVVATQQGGILLATAQRSVEPLAAALDHALAHLRSWMAG